MKNTKKTIIAVLIIAIVLAIAAPGIQAYVINITKIVTFEPDEAYYERLKIENNGDYSLYCGGDGLCGLYIGLGKTQLIGYSKLQFELALFEGHSGLLMMDGKKTEVTWELVDDHNFTVTDSKGNVYEGTRLGERMVLKKSLSTYYLLAPPYPNQ